MRLPLFVVAGLAVVTVLAACGQPAPAALPDPAPTTSASPTTGGPVITAFQVIDEINCSGAQASVPTRMAVRRPITHSYQMSDGARSGSCAARFEAPDR